MGACASGRWCALSRARWGLVWGALFVLAAGATVAAGTLTAYGLVTMFLCLWAVHFIHFTYCAPETPSSSPDAAGNSTPVKRAADDESLLSAGLDLFRMQNIATLQVTLKTRGKSALYNIIYKGATMIDKNLFI